MKAGQEASVRAEEAAAELLRRQEEDRRDALFASAVEELEVSEDEDEEWAAADALREGLGPYDERLVRLLAAWHEYNPELAGAFAQETIEQEQNARSFAELMEQAQAQAQAAADAEREREQAQYEEAVADARRRNPDFDELRPAMAALLAHSGVIPQTAEEGRQQLDFLLKAARELRRVEEEVGIKAGIAAAGPLSVQQSLASGGKVYADFNVVDELQRALNPDALDPARPTGLRTDDEIRAGILSDYSDAKARSVQSQLAGKWQAEKGPEDPFPPSVQQQLRGIRPK